MKIAVNRCFGGFSVSRDVVNRLRAKGYKIPVDGELYSDGSGIVSDGDRWGYYLDNNDFGIESENYLQYRCHPDLIEAIEASIPNQSGCHSNVQIVDIPEEVDWEIDEYDGSESIHEKHRSW